MDGGGGFGGALCRGKVLNNHLQGKAALYRYSGLLGCGMDRLISLPEQAWSDVLVYDTAVPWTPDEQHLISCMS